MSYVCCRSKPGLQWDTTALDKVLHIFTPVILLKFGLILLFVMRPLREPYKSIECFTPKEFVSMWTKYTEKICLGKSHVYIQETEKSDTTNSTHPPGGLLPGYSNVFNQVRVFFRNRFRWHQYNAQLSPITCGSQTPVLIFIRCSNIHTALDRQIDG